MLPPLANILAKPEAVADDDEEPSDAQLEAAALLVRVEGAEPSDSVAGAEKMEGADDEADVGAGPKEKVGAAAAVEKLKVGAADDQAAAGSAVGTAARSAWLAVLVVLLSAVEFSSAGRRSALPEPR